MGDPVTLSYIAIASVGVGTAVSIDQQSKARKAQQRAGDEQRARNASEAARERRQQIREERVKRARIAQASENTGVQGGSGELGATAGLGTNLASNIGANLGRIQTANQISLFEQQAANYMMNANIATQVGNLGFQGASLFAGQQVKSKTE
jgi:hypothetical protein